MNVQRSHLEIRIYTSNIYKVKCGRVILSIGYASTSFSEWL